MFFSLLFATLLTSLATSFTVALLFRKSVGGILARIMHDEISTAWQRYIIFAVIVVGISSGVNLYKIEQYVPGAQGHWIEQTKPDGDKEPEWVPPVLNDETWTLEIYRTVIGTIQGIAWALLVFFLVALVAFVIVRGQEIRAKV
ncbi:MAG: hypothetical protein IPK53_18495 [bacterium]|nr:hypothetical protein [bacterium]MBK8130805.1 hypothetical protein [bacterium]